MGVSLLSSYWVVQSLLWRLVLASCNIKMLEEYLGMKLGLCTIAWASAWCVGVMTIDYVKNVGITYMYEPCKAETIHRV